MEASVGAKVVDIWFHVVVEVREAWKTGLGRQNPKDRTEWARDTMEYGTGVAWVIRTFYDQGFRGYTPLYKHISKVYHMPTKFSREKAFCAVEKSKEI